MAISSGVGPHFAWAIVNGAQFPVESGTVHLTATKKPGIFSATIPMQYPGALAALADPGDNYTSIVVSTRGQTATLISGEIDDVEIEYVGGEYQIHICGRDPSAKLHDQKSSEKWVNKTPGEIITDLAGRVGLGVKIASPVAIKMQRKMKDDYTKLTDNISFAMVIHKLSEFMGAHWYVKDGTLNIVPSDGSTSSGYSVSVWLDGEGRIVSDALALKIKHNVQAGKPIDLAVKSWHTRHEKVYEGQQQISGKGTTKKYRYNLPNLTQEHVDQHAKSKAQDHKRNEIEITAQCVGDPSIDISQGLSISGTDFDGTYTIDAIEHEFGYEGHTMTITAKGPQGGGGIS
jgi:prophage tail gpP-like protein